jgi:hypothetical protein
LLICPTIVSFTIRLPTSPSVLRAAPPFLRRQRQEPGGEGVPQPGAEGGGSGSATTPANWSSVRTPARSVRARGLPPVAAHRLDRTAAVERPGRAGGEEKGGRGGRVDPGGVVDHHEHRLPSGRGGQQREGGHAQRVRVDRPGRTTQRERPTERVRLRPRQRRQQG